MSTPKPQPARYDGIPKPRPNAEQIPASADRRECSILAIRWLCDHCETYTEIAHSQFVRLAAGVRFLCRECCTACNRSKGIAANVHAQ